MNPLLMLRRVLVMLALARGAIAAEQPCQSSACAPTMTFISSSPAFNDFSYGWKFTPSVDGRITQLWANLANTREHTVRVWTTTGTLIASASIVTVVNTWVAVAIDPVPIAAGASYIIAVRNSGTFRYSAPPMPLTSGNIIIVEGRYLTNTDAMPLAKSPLLRGAVDLTFEAGTESVATATPVDTATPLPTAPPTLSPTVVPTVVSTQAPAVQLSIPDVTVSVGSTQRIVVALHGGPVARTYDIALTYAAEGVRVGALQLLAPGCMSAHATEGGVIRLALLCSERATRNGALFAVDVTGLVPGRSIITVRECGVGDVVVEAGIARETMTTCAPTFGDVVVVRESQMPFGLLR